jgi:hypothetical protein
LHLPRSPYFGPTILGLLMTVPIVVFQVMGAITYRLIEGFGPLVILLLLIAGAIKLWEWFRRRQTCDGPAPARAAEPRRLLRYL